MDILNSSTSKLVTSAELAKAPSLSIITRLNGCCSFFNVVRTKLMIYTDTSLDAVGNNHIIIVFEQKTVTV